MKRKFWIVLLTILTALCLLIGLVACNTNGKDGSDGNDGKDGKSAFEIWKEIYGEDDSTEEDFLDWLKGKDGKDGVDGKDGTDGKDGKDGVDAHEHSYGEWTTALEPTCTSIGYDARECDCGDVDYRFNEATGHIVESYIRGDSVTHAYICETCGLVIEERHDFDEDGVCNGCGLKDDSNENDDSASLSDLYSWIDGLKLEDIVKVRYEHGGIAVAPGSPVDIAYSTNSIDIENTYALLFSELEAIDLGEGIVGGSYDKYVFYTANGDTFTIYVENDIVRINGQYYHVKNFNYKFQYGVSGDVDIDQKEEIIKDDGNV